MIMSFKKCLEKNKIVKSEEAKYLIDKELDLAREDFIKARDGIERKEYRWPTIQCYYSMFHSARALLYSKGYREKSHICLHLAMKEIFVESGLLPIDLVENFKQSRLLREEADYKGDFSEENAKQLLKSAKEFVKFTKKILGK